MKRFRFRFFRFGRPRRSVKVRSTSVLFKRYSSFEGLELRSMLSGSSLLADSALVSTPLTDDPYVSPINQLSLASMLSSTLAASEDAPAAAPLATNATEDGASNGVPTADPLVEGQTIRVTVALEDLNGNAITHVTAGNDFKVKVFVTDIRSNPTLPGVSGAFVNLSYNTNLISLVDPSDPLSLVIDPAFNGLLPGLKDTSTAGHVIAGGNYVELNPDNLPDPGQPQLLFTVTLRAIASGDATFTTQYDNFEGDGEWGNVGVDDVIVAENVDFQSASLTVDALPTLSVSDVSQNESNANSNYLFTVTLSQASSQQVTVVYNTTAGTATAGSDFTAASGTLTFEAGATQKVITIGVLGDTNAEEDETFSVVLSSPTNATLADATGLGTILDDDAPLLTIQDVSQVEQDGVNTMVFTVTISKAAAGNVTVQYSTADGTATVAGNDYSATSGTLTFLANSTDAQLITVTINGDTTDEDNETFKLTLSNPSGAELVGDGEATSTLVNDDGPILALNPTSVSQTEGDAGTSLVFTVTLSEANDEPVFVAYNTANGTATAGSDYTATSGTLTFAAGSTISQFVTVAITGDNLDEADETFSLVLSSPQNASIAVDTSVGTILDDDGPAITLEGPSSRNENSGNYVITAKLASASSQTVTVAWTTANGTATAGSDYTAASGTLTFAPGQTTQLITVSLTGDEVVEANETFKINLSNAVNGELGQTEFTGTIANDDDVPTVEVTAPSSQNEGNVGSTPFVFTVKLSKAGTEAITVVYNTANAIAQAGSDYTATSGTLTFAVGELTKTVTVLVTGDTLHEDASETFRVQLSSPTNATLKTGANSATATIVDDDAKPTISISDATGTEGDSGTKQFVFTVTLSNPSIQGVSVVYTTQNGTATAGVDYTATSGTLSFAPNELTKLITVNVIGDLLNEENETFSVVLSSPVEASLGDTTGIGTIEDETSDNVNVVPSSIAGKVFIDSNNNGAQNGLEKSLAGITVNLTGAATASTTTAADGSYSFANLNPGTYTVKFVLPSQYRDGAAILGNSGGSQVEDGYTITIAAPGGVAGTGYHFATRGLLPQFISQRLFLSSYLAELSAGVGQVGVSINSVTNPINAANANSTSISGTGTIGATISVVASDGTNSTAAQTTTVGSNGAWSISSINVSALNNGTITFTATASGSGTTDTDTITSTKDTVAPDVAITTVTNPVRASNATDTAISGTGTVGATISVIVTDGTNSTSAKTTTVNAAGTWSIGGINLTSLANGTVTYNVTASDTAGNTKTASQTSTKDTEAPTLAISSVTNPINAANQNAVTISGTGTADDTITVTITDSGSGSVGPLTTTVAANGTWTIASINLTSLASGTITFTAVATDGVGNTAQDVETVVKDTVTEVAINSVTDPINAANQSATTISGTGEVGAGISVIVSDGTNSTSAVTTTVAANGTWSITNINVSDLGDGVLTYTVTATDTAGNTDLSEIEADKDTVAPLISVEDVTDLINRNNDDAVAISGTGEAGATISVVVSDGTTTTAAFTTTVNGQGTWSISTVNVSSLDDGTLTFTATATDSAGNSATDTITAQKSTVAISDLTDPITQANQEEVSVSGTGTIGASISVIATDGTNSTTAATTTVDAQGNWTVTINVTSLEDGTVTFNVTATDGEDSATTSGNATKDTVAEGEILEGSDPVNAANVTNVVVTGTSELDATVSVVVTDGENTTAPVAAVAEAGVWLASGIDISDLEDGPITYKATVTDALGNVTVYTLLAVKDTLPPTLSEPTLPPLNSASASDYSLSGTTEAGATVTVTFSKGAVTIGPTQASVTAEGAWTLDGVDLTSLADGSITLTIVATDAAGNSTTITPDLNKDTTPPNVDATLVEPNVIAAATASEVTVSGTGQVGATLSVSASDGANTVEPAPVTVDGEGNWSITLNVTTLADGLITFTATATEDSGNTATDTITADKDTVSFVTVILAGGKVSSTNLSSAAVSGSREPSAALTVSITDGVTTIDRTYNGGSIITWSITGIDLTSLADGPLTIIATATDSLGNQAIQQIVVQKDTTTTVAISEVTDPINADNVASTIINGTGEVGATISVTASDGINSTIAFAVVVGGDGNWSINGIDVSALADGTITYTVTATDTFGNSDQKQITAVKDTSAEPLTLLANVEEADDAVGEEEDLLSFD